MGYRANVEIQLCVSDTLSVCLSVCLYYLSSLFSSSSHPLVAFFTTFQSLSRRRKIVIFDNMLNQRRSATFIRLRWLYGYKLKSKTRDGIFFRICDFHRNNTLMLSRVISSYMRRASTFPLFPVHPRSTTTSTFLYHIL